jgi:hypothetical protein
MTTIMPKFTPNSGKIEGLALNISGGSDANLDGC